MINQTQLNIQGRSRADQTAMGIHRGPLFIDPVVRIIPREQLPHDGDPLLVPRLQVIQFISGEGKHKWDVHLPEPQIVASRRLTWNKDLTACPRTWGADPSAEAVHAGLPVRELPD